MKPAAPPVPANETADDEEPDDDEEETADTKTKAGFQGSLQKLQTSIIDLSKKAGATAVRRDAEFQKDRTDLDEKLAELERSARKVQLTEEQKEALVRLGGELDVLEQKTKPGFWDSALALALSIYGALSVVQAVVVHCRATTAAAIARDASLLLGVAPEDPPLAPRVRLNLAWVRRKLRQRTRSLLVFLPGVALISLAALPFPEQARVTSVLISLWAAYWWVVWTASKSARAWEREGGPLTVVPPVVARPRRHVALHRLAGQDPGSPLGAFDPCCLFAGRGGGGAAGGIRRPRRGPRPPAHSLLKLFVRPLVPVAAARLLAERTVRSERLLGSTKERAATAAQRASMPASPGALEARDEM